MPADMINASMRIRSQGTGKGTKGKERKRKEHGYTTIFKSKKNYFNTSHDINCSFRPSGVVNWSTSALSLSNSISN